MMSLLVLVLCAAAPWTICATLRALLTVGDSAPASTRDRALRHFRQATLAGALTMLPAAAVLGALFVDPSLATRWPTLGSWFFAMLSGVTAWVSLALARRTPEESTAMRFLETVGRAVQLSVAPVLASGLALLAFRAIEAFLPFGPMMRAVTAGLLGVAAVVVISPWLIIELGVWPSFPRRLESDGVSWRVVHLPAPTPFLTHTAALPWLHAVLVSDGLFNRAPERHWHTLVRYEVGGSSTSRLERAARWAIAVPMSTLVFLTAGAVGADNPRKLVAAIVLAVFFTATASWLANRKPPAKLALDGDGPSMQELAQTLRSLPPCLGQALPRTSHKPLGAAVYNRLFALGHDPGRRPHS